MDQRDRLLELVDRLGADLWGRVVAAAGVAGVVWAFLDARLALIWLTLFGINEGFELWAAHGIRKSGAHANRFEVAFLANLSFGSTVWGATAWIFWTGGGVGDIVIGLAMTLGALYHVSCHCISHVRSLIAAGMPLLAVFVAMSVQMLMDQRYENSVALEATIGFVFLGAYMTTALLESLQRDKRLRTALREAKTATLAKSQFLAVMSHEIRTPMNGVIGMLDLLIRHDLEYGQRMRAQAALQSSRDLMVILDDILTFSKLEAGQDTFEHLPVSVRYLMSTTIQLFTPAAGEKGVKLDWTIAAKVPDWIEGDPSRLRQILSNLISNAIKFTERGSIQVLVDHNGDPTEGRLAVFVNDTGIGVTKEQRGRLFKPFSQADVSTMRLYGGTGLGLAICKQLVDAMGGQIGVVSEPGAGSQFWFVVPARPTSAPRPPASRAAITQALDTDRRSLKVLVVEDHPVSRQLLRMLLELAGHKVFETSDGDAAIKRLQEETFDLVLMDVQMPLTDGPTAARFIRTVEGPNRSVPIIAVTANTDVADRKRYLASGMTDCVGKPLEAGILYEAIERATGAASHSE